MRSTPVLRTLAAALLTGGTLAVAAAGTHAATAPSTTPATTSPAFAEGRGGGHGGGGGPIWGTVVSGTELNVRSSPTTNSGVVTALSPGSQDRVQCMVQGQSVNGNPYWYWLVGAQGWASAAFVNTGGAWVPTCSDPCPQWKNGNWSNWDDPYGWNNSYDPYATSWSAAGSGSWSASGSWSWSSAGSSGWW
ncbi:SH3 domain-containing protein [Streptomyces acidiscabies]|uniref:SH3 domain-containing protein n=1 Tax=Streptomyces acidiscabies TaxID=42234 RepID=A0AAP6BBI3_9ACTN|nr:SH3 domain-containing protein [Streptomyces acidiscabies]MBP5938157.1 SH3 domain-containing protein [Streptomyces sp. LBUM 1476]MBZ3909169.1 SH3 domain-containing protein [Streptomyces acidiscabies]MDX2961707.1 SH3 domain-containing protein [Streptomyces acidiscabies]MDX3016424.1 SH3 domain-containing protein [Streptomyces acidiscabies]MDX3788670.1 SH3 domain-containing protein [Streptomyces acidiscabies]